MAFNISIAAPSFSIHLYSIKQDVEFRPYTVGEEKLLLMCAQSKDPKFISMNTKKVIQGCILTEGINVGKLAAYDIENLLLKIRAKSEGETVELNYQDPETKQKFPVIVDLEKIDVTFFPEHEYKIPLTETVGLVMRDLNFEDSLKYRTSAMVAAKTGKTPEEIQTEIVYEAIVDCIEKIYDEDTVYVVGESVSRTEAKDWLMSLVGARKPIMEFFNTMPVVKYETTLPNGEVITINNINDFLG